MAKRTNEDSEPGRKVQVNLTPEDLTLAERLKIELHQTGKGYTGLVRALMLEAAKSRGWKSPYAHSSTAEGAEGAQR